jgi:hypothetical protein
VSEPRPEAVTAATAPLLRHLPSLGADRCRNLAAEVLAAALPHLDDRESQDGLAEKMRAAFAEYGLSAEQVAGVEGECARLIEETVRRPYPRVPKQRHSPERAG